MKQPLLGLFALLIVGVAIVKIDSESTAQATSPLATPTAIPLDDSEKSDKPAEDVPMVIEDSMHEFMEYVFQPPYKRLRVTMATEPQNNSGWKAMKSDSLILAESCNLLFPRTPETDGEDWKKHSVNSRNHGADLYRAARAKDFKKASGAYRLMLNSCNSCHRQFENGKHILKP